MTDPELNLYPDVARRFRLSDKPFKSRVTPKKGRMPVPPGFKDTLARLGVFPCSRFYKVSDSTIKMWMDEEGLEDTGFVRRRRPAPTEAPLLSP